MAGEVLEGRGGGPFFALKEHRDKRSGELEGGGDFCAARVDDVREAIAFGTVADLIVILIADEKMRGRNSMRRVAMSSFAVPRVLATVIPAISQRLGEMR